MYLIRVPHLTASPPAERPDTINKIATIAVLPTPSNPSRRMALVYVLKRLEATSKFECRNLGFHADLQSYLTRTYTEFS